MSMFQDLIETIASYNKHYPKNSQELHIAFNEVSGCEARYILPKDVENLVRHLCKLKQAEESLYCKAFLLLEKLLNTSKVSIQHELSVEAQDWIVTVMMSHEDTLLLECLRSLTVLVKYSSQISDQVFTAILLTDTGIAMRYLNLGVKKAKTTGGVDGVPHIEVVLTLVRCIEMICVKSTEAELEDKQLDHLAIICDTLLRILSNTDPQSFGENYTRFADNSLRIFNFMVNNRPEWVNNQETLSTLVGCFKVYATDQEIVCKPSKVTPSGHILPEEPKPVNFKANKIKKKPRVAEKFKKKTDKSKADAGSNLNIKPEPFTFMSFSDSDHSEIEAHMLQSAAKLRQKLQIDAMSLIVSTTQVAEKRNLFGYWYTFFNDPPSISLLTIMKDDPSYKCRSLALQTATVIIFKLRQYLSHAEISMNTPSSFTPFSAALGNSIKNIYASIEHILSHDNHSGVIVQALKCLSTLIGATSFINVIKFVIRPLLKNVQKQLNSKDFTIKVASMTVIESLLSASDLTENALLEVIPISSVEEENETDLMASLSLNENKDDNEWVFSTLFSYLNTSLTPNTTVQLRIQSLQILQAMSSYINFYKKYLKSIAKSLCYLLTNGCKDTKLHASKAFYAITQNVNGYLTQNTDYRLLESYYCFWLENLSIVVAEMQNNENPSQYRSILCDAFTNLECIYDRLSREKQLFLISLITGTAYDEDVALRGSAVRCLAIFTHFSVLKEDSCFIENSINIAIKIYEEGNVQTKIKASWSLSDMSDIFMGDSEVTVSYDTQLKLFESCLKSQKENEKIRINLTRCVGNCLSLLTAKHLSNEKFCKIIEEVIQLISKNMLCKDSMKLKWNACYAAQNLMKNDEVFNGRNVLNWQKHIFEPLRNTLLQSQNFKVKISCVNALRVPTSKKSYGSYFVAIWNALLTSLVESNNLVDLYEYKHKDNLQEQICLTISHFLMLVDKESLVPFGSPLYSSDAIKDIWIRSWTRLAPEYYLNFNFNPNIDGLSKNLSPEQELALNMLKNYFVIETPI